MMQSFEFKTDPRTGIQVGTAIKTSPIQAAEDQLAEFRKTHSAMLAQWITRYLDEAFKASPLLAHGTIELGTIASDVEGLLREATYEVEDFLRAARRKMEE